MISGPSGGRMGFPKYCSLCERLCDPYFLQARVRMSDLQFQGHQGTSHPRTPLSAHWIELPLGKGKKVATSYIINSEGGFLTIEEQKRS